MANTPSFLGRELARRRQLSGLALRPFAAKCGVPHSTVQDLESGAQQDTTTETVRKIAEGCGVSATAFLEAVEKLRTEEERKRKVPKRSA